jgi:multiple sugar transport system ATP-binding protein
MNLVGVDLARSDSRVVAKIGEDTLEVDERVLARRPGLKAFEGKRLILGVRPEDLEDEAFANDASSGRRLSAQVDIREDMGSEVFIHFGVAGKPVRGEDVKAAVGEEAIEVAEGKGNVWVARVDRDTKAQEGGNIELVVDTTRLHFFDPETGDAIYGDS